jgi:hypothetical protein
MGMITVAFQWSRVGPVALGVVRRGDGHDSLPIAAINFWALGPGCGLRQEMGRWSVLIVARRGEMIGVLR